MSSGHSGVATQASWSVVLELPVMYPTQGISSDEDVEGRYPGDWAMAVGQHDASKAKPTWGEVMVWSTSGCCTLMTRSSQLDPVTVTVVPSASEIVVPSSAAVPGLDIAVDETTNKINTTKNLRFNFATSSPARRQAIVFSNEEGLKPVTALGEFSPQTARGPTLSTGTIGQAAARLCGLCVEGGPSEGPSSMHEDSEIPCPPPGRSRKVSAPTRTIQERCAPARLCLGSGASLTQPRAKPRAPNLAPFALEFLPNVLSSISPDIRRPFALPNLANLAQKFRQNAPDSAPQMCW